MLLLWLAACADPVDLPPDWLDHVQRGGDFEVRANGFAQTFSADAHTLVIHSAPTSGTLGGFAALVVLFAVLAVVIAWKSDGLPRLTGAVAFVVCLPIWIYLVPTSEVRLGDPVVVRHSYAMGWIERETVHAPEALRPAAWHVVDDCDDNGCSYWIDVSMPRADRGELPLLELGHTGGLRPAYDAAQQRAAEALVDGINARVPTR